MTDQTIKPGWYVINSSLGMTVLWRGEDLWSGRNPEWPDMARPDLPVGWTIGPRVEDAHEEGRREALAWRPIETAPKDGTEIDLWRCYPESGTGFRIADCSWSSDLAASDLAAKDGIISGWVDDWCDPIEWGPDQYGQRCIVTHWMPLPESPSDGIDRLDSSKDDSQTTDI